jgi:LysR family transcriptional regulator, hypochlorite-specific transcription factor HypT
MDLRWLEDLCSLAQTRSFSRSAEERNITQPAFSRRIKALELWVGTPLIDRSTYPTALTAAGRVFVETAEGVLRSLNSARHELSGADRREANVVHLAALHTLSLTFFPSWIRDIQRQIGPIGSRLLSDNMHNCVQSLVEGDSDLLLCYTHPSVPMLLDPTRFPSVTLGSDIVLPVSAPRDRATPLYALPGQAESPLPFLAYSPDSFLGLALELLMRRRHEPCYLSCYYENSFSEALKAMAVDGQGLTWLPEQSVRHELSSGRLVRAGDPTWDLRVEIRLYRSLDKRRPQVERLWNLLSAAQLSRQRSYAEIA